jgi:hypothetical protein
MAEEKYLTPLEQLDLVLTKLNLQGSGVYFVTVTSGSNSKLRKLSSNIKA